MSVSFGFCAAPDLIITSSVGISPNPITVGSNLTVSYSVKNIGNANAAASKKRIQVKLGSSTTVTTQITNNTSALNAGVSRNDTATVPIPAGTSAGDYTVYVILDYNDATGQSDTSPASDIYQTSTGALTIQAAVTKPDLIRRSAFIPARKSRTSPPWPAAPPTAPTRPMRIST